MIKDNVFIVPVSNPFGKFGKIKHTLTLPFIQYDTLIYVLRMFKHIWCIRC